MPICILSIPRNQTDIPLPKLESICEEVLQQTHSILEIPNPEDMESRIIRTDKEQPELSVSLTVGDYEYPGFHPESFHPTQEQLENTLAAITQIEGIENLNLGKIRIEAWRDSVFRELEANGPDTKPIIAETTQNFNDLPQIDCGISVSLSPNYVARTQEGGQKEQESQSVGGEFSPLRSRLENLFGPESERRTELHVRETLSADTDVSVEVDLKSEHSLTPSQMESVALTIEAELRNAKLMKEGETTTVWVRLGKADIIKSVSCLS